MRLLAQRAGRNYTNPWDASKILGCVCDAGWRGPDCRLKECPSEEDPVGGPGPSSGRDCSGRGTCDYNRGVCVCYPGFYGISCEVKSFMS
jgi:hypothetical protein